MYMSQDLMWWKILKKNCKIFLEPNKAHLVSLPFLRPGDHACHVLLPRWFWFPAGQIINYLFVKLGTWTPRLGPRPRLSFSCMAETDGDAFLSGPQPNACNGNDDVSAKLRVKILFRPCLDGGWKKFECHIECFIGCRKGYSDTNKKN